MKIKMPEDEIYDVAIIGAGMGGLACANILSKEGLKVLLLDKNRQLGGNLQIFSRNRTIFDTGVHYLGALDKGQILNQMFGYFGILDGLKLRRMDEDGFEKIHFYNEKIYYPYGMGYDHFIKVLTQYFPDEEEAITAYIRKIQDIVSKLPLAKLTNSSDSIIDIDVHQTAKDYISSITHNIRLQKVLGGTNMLYAGAANTPFFIHALVINSYIESSWRCVDGTAQIVKGMMKEIKKYGGVVLNRAKVVGASFHENNEIRSIQTEDGREFHAKSFISNLHPTVTIDLFGKTHFTPGYLARMKNLKNTGSVFILHLVFQENSFKYLNHNIFQINQEDIWDLYTANQENWPSYFMFSNHANGRNPEFANGASIICGITNEEIEQWKSTENTVLNQKSRGEDYENYKNKMAEKVITALEDLFPDIRSKIKAHYCTTPLTFRDYTSTPDGSAYGIEKDAYAPYKSMISPKTPIPNLFLAGQNLNLHGIVGVSISSIITCSYFIDKAELIRKIQSH